MNRLQAATKTTVNVDFIVHTSSIWFKIVVGEIKISTSRRSEECKPTGICSGRVQAILRLIVLRTLCFEKALVGFSHYSAIKAFRLY